jgi:uncharacterized membrane-anchored protein YhcB (DUF1043 family)
VLVSKNPLQQRPPNRLKRVRWLGVPLLAALVIGIQLGAIPWRYRRQIWQAQGVLVGIAVGYLIGRLSDSDRC